MPRITPHKPIVHVFSLSSILLRTTAEEAVGTAEKALVFGDIYEVGSCVQQHPYTKRIYRKRILLNLSLFTTREQFLSLSVSLTLSRFHALSPRSSRSLAFSRIHHRPVNSFAFISSNEFVVNTHTHTIFLFKSLPFIQHKCFALCYRRCFWPFFPRFSYDIQYFAFAGPFISICWIVCFNTWKMFMLLQLVLRSTKIHGRWFFMSLFIWAIQSKQSHKLVSF